MSHGGTLMNGKEKVTEKLKRITSEADSHKVLDVGYLAAAVIGAWQFGMALQVIQAGGGTLWTILIAAQMALFSICGSLAYAWHIRGQVYLEATMIAPLWTGLATVMVGLTAKTFNFVDENVFLATMGGLSVAIGAWFLIEYTERLYKILKRRRQIIRSEKALAELNKPINQAAITAKVENLDSPTKPQQNP